MFDKIKEELRSGSLKWVSESYTVVDNKLFLPLRKGISVVFGPINSKYLELMDPFYQKWAVFTNNSPILSRVIKYGYNGSRLLILGLLLLILLTIFGAFGSMPTAEELKNIETANATEIYTMDSVLLGKFYIENRTEISLVNISPYVVTALLAVEDKRFFEHSGIDLMSWARALKGIATNSKGLGGGSTLSQQLAKNLYPRRKYWVSSLSIFLNKIRENVVSTKLENIYNKEELLTLYLNTVPFGGDRYGINVASKYFYDKKAKDLLPAESATLIGMLKATTALDPTRNPENSKKRRNLVLTRMLQNNDFEFNSESLVTITEKIKLGKLSQEEYDKVIELPVSAKKYYTDFTDGSGTYFREYLRTYVMKNILKDLTKEDGTSYNLYRDGLKIYTTLDSKMQEYGEESVAKHMNYLQGQFKKHWKGYPNSKPWGDDKWIDEQKVRSPRYEKLKESEYSDVEIDSIFNLKIPMTVFDWKKGGGDIDTTMSPLDSVKHYFLMLNTGFMAMSHKNGYIKAWVGGTNFKYFKYDHILGRRQVGSTFKPIVYAAAIKDSIKPCTYIRNAQVTYGDWTPGNSDGSYGGWYSMIGGLTYSVNSIAAYLINKVGIQKTLDLAKTMGVTNELPREFGISLGAADISLYDMMKVYGTIANDGLRPEPVTVLKIIDRGGNVIYSYEDEVKKGNAGPKVQALKEDEAATVGRMMRSVIDNGTGNKLRSQYVPDGEFSGKTGTTQNNSDGWFIAFNQELVTGCWVGAPSPAVRFRTMDLGQGSAMALPIVGGFWYKLLRDRKFTKIALAKFKVNEKANSATGCPMRIGINPNELYEMMQDSTLADEIRSRGYRNLKELRDEVYGTEDGEVFDENYIPTEGGPLQEAKPISPPVLPVDKNKDQLKLNEPTKLKMEIKKTDPKSGGG
jgi:penicillin-binding protein 1A